MSNLEIIKDITSKIQELHASAQSYADKAVKDATSAGELLLEAKKQLPHGQFLYYIRTELSISVRQCQRYMAAAQGKGKLSLMELTTKCDRMSHLQKDEQDGVFLPSAGFVYMLPNKEGADILALVECTKGYENYFFVTVYENQQGTRWTTKRPVEDSLVHQNLEYFGLRDPQLQKWKFKPSKGVSEPEETLYGPSGQVNSPIKPLNAPRRMNLETEDFD